MQLNRNNMSSLPLEHQMPQLNFKCCFDLMNKVTVIHCFNVQSYRSIFNHLRKFRSSAGVHPSAKWNGRSKDRSTSSTCNSSFQFWDTQHADEEEEIYIYTSHLLSQDVPLNVMNEWSPRCQGYCLDLGSHSLALSSLYRQCQMQIPVRWLPLHQSRVTRIADPKMIRHLSAGSTRSVSELLASEVGVCVCVPMMAWHGVPAARVMHVFSHRDFDRLDSFY